MKSKFALAAIVAILAVSVVANAFWYSEQHSFALDASLQKEANSELQQQIANLQKQLANLTGKADYLQNQNVYLKDQNVALETQLTLLANQTFSLQTENTNLKATVANLLPYQPNRSVLVTRVGTTDVLNSSNAHSPFRPRLYIQGEVFNLGDRTAYNARLHVTLYIDDQIVQDTYIELGNIEPLNYASVSRDIFYEANGQRLTNWTIKPET